MLSGQARQPGKCAADRTENIVAAVHLHPAAAGDRAPVEIHLSRTTTFEAANRRPKVICDSGVGNVPAAALRDVPSQREHPIRANHGQPRGRAEGQAAQGVAFRFAAN